MDKEQICEHYKYCTARRINLRDCTKPAFEDCLTYKTWQEHIALGVGAIVLPGNNLTVEVAENSTKTQ